MNRSRLSLAILALVLSLSGTAIRSSAGFQSQPAPASVLPASGACFTAALLGTSEVPPNNSAVMGQATVVLAPTQLSITYYISYTGTLSGTETTAHFHRGDPGVAGPIVYPLPAGNPKTGTQTFTISDTNDLLAGLLYVNIHSTNFPDGEIRGQLRPSGACFTAEINGAQETPTNDSAVKGTGIFGLSPDQRTLIYDIRYTGTLSGTETAAHFHRGDPGVAGPIIYSLPAGNPKTGTQTLTISDTSDLLAGLLYVNIHSTNFSGGEIRGQINPATNCFITMLSGAEETPPTTSTASGYGTFILSADRTTFTYRIQTTGVISETVAHIHRAPIGVPGPIVFPLPVGSLKQGRVTLTVTDTNDLLTGQFYVNIHSTANPDGDIRGQIGAGACQTYLPVVMN